MKKSDLNLTIKENLDLEILKEYISNLDISKLNNLEYKYNVQIKNEYKLLDKTGVYNLEKYLFDYIDK